jgi:imidazole glycerol-phosphate synthase subunit HisF
MFRPRVIPILLLKGKGLVKSVKFKNHRYIGDPINAVRIFNDFKADELVFLDIIASIEKRTISLDFVRNVGDEANMPFSVGGGIRSIRNIRDIINCGAEKVILNTYAVENPDFIKKASEEFGSTTIVISMDVKNKIFGRRCLKIVDGTKSTVLDPVVFARKMEKFGAGEIIINSIDRDGEMNGYDLKLIEEVSKAVTIPVVAAGGCKSMGDFTDAINKSYASAVSAGSLFVYHGPRKAVLISYPTQSELRKLFSE